MGLKERTLPGSGLTPYSATIFGQRTDWDEGTVPLIWVAKGTLRGRALWTGLVQAWFAAAKAAEDATEPPYSEFTPADNTLLDEEDIQAIAQQVWPEDTDEDLQD